MKKLTALLVVAAAGLLFAGSNAAPGTATAYYDSSKSNIYHFPSCTWAKKITREHLIIFETKEQAQSKGYRPCKVCKP
jgi:micrococcal nuclease